MNASPFPGQAILITGGAWGISETGTRLFRDAAATGAVLDRDKSRAGRVASELEVAGVRAHMRDDPSKIASISKCVAEALSTIYRVVAPVNGADTYRDPGDMLRAEPAAES